MNLNDNQFNTLNRSYQDSWNRFNQGANNLGNLNEQQRMQQMQQLEGRFNQEFGQALDSTFTDPRARQRFNQLNNQFSGFDAFNNRDVRQQLNLTPEQQRQLRGLSSAWRQRMQQLRRAGNDAQLTDQQWAQLQAQNMQQLNTVLTPQQQQLWSQMVGQQYNFPSSLYLGNQNNSAAAVAPGQGGQPQTIRGAAQQSGGQRQNNTQTGQQQSSGASTVR
jgi:hypothetical protein